MAITSPRESQLRLYDHGIQAKFEVYNREHPEVYTLLVRFAREAKLAGYKHYGIKALMERLRWHVNIERNDGDFKINNSFASRYARRISDLESDLRDFFEKRVLKA